MKLGFMGWELASRPRRENSKGKSKSVVLFFKSLKVRFEFQGTHTE